MLVGSPQELVKAIESLRFERDGGFGLDSTFDTQGMDGDTGVAGVPGLPIRTG